MDVFRRALFLPLLVLLATAAAADEDVVISQIYGDGGNVGAKYGYDFIELFNRGLVNVDLNGWSVQYAKAGGAATWFVTPLSGTLAPGQYYLVREAKGANEAQDLPAHDAQGVISMNATDAQVALVRSRTPLSGNCPSGTADFVKYGGASCPGGTATDPPSNTKAVLRKSEGCTDTGNNQTDFAVLEPSPRNRQTAPHPCQSNAPPAIVPPSNPIRIVDQDAPPFPVSLDGWDDHGIYAWSSTGPEGITRVDVSGGQGEPRVTYTVTLRPGFSGTARFQAVLDDRASAKATQDVAIQVNAVAVNLPPSIDEPSAGPAMQDQPFEVRISGRDDNDVFRWDATAGEGVAAVVLSSVQGQATAVFTATPKTGFSGVATVRISLSDTVNPAVSLDVEVDVTPVGLPGDVVISQIYSASGADDALFQRDYVELYNRSSAEVRLDGWSIQYASATGTTWQEETLQDSIGPGQYYLILLARGGSGGSPIDEANVDGTLNLSGKAGKVALFRTSPRRNGCPAGDATIVDRVSYGAKSDCAEGGKSAPAGSAGLAMFRKNGGATDTDVNGDDFETGVPNPGRRTAPIPEHGPAVRSIDPQILAPRDASVTVKFSEPVTVRSNWFSITCAVTGLHDVNNMTVASARGDTLRVLTPIDPARIFRSGESCSGIIRKDRVEDVDDDDSAPGTATLAKDFAWTFRIATGDAPAYPPDVHLTMGKPSPASLATPDDYLMVKPEFALSYNRGRGIANWASWHLDDTWIGDLQRADTFRPDPEVPPGEPWYRVLETDYSETGFQRGHLVPNADRDNRSARPVNQATYLMTNVIPQAVDNNDGPWGDLEDHLRKFLPANEVYIVAGGLGAGGVGEEGAMTSIAEGRVTVPAETWKVALVLPKGENDVARVDASTRTIAVIMPNAQELVRDWRTYLTTVDHVEARTGLDFFSNVAGIVEDAIEAGVDGANPPGVGDSSVTTDEDQPKAFTLQVVSANAGAVQYTFAGPAHGRLSGQGAARTYVPEEDFNGTDSFTFTASDAGRNSRAAAVTITVVPVNDRPRARNDVAATLRNQPVDVDLLRNDTPGPADEHTQRLTVQKVTRSNATHGTLTLRSGGKVRYTPDASFTGTASFSYTVCDDGTSRGVADAQCADATVKVVVTGSARRRRPVRS